MAEDYTFFLPFLTPLVVNQKQIRGMMRRRNKSLKQNAGQFITEKN
jgi:hypothetical protein